MSKFERSTTSGSVPGVDDIQTVFSKHFSNYTKTSGEVSYQQLQNEESIRRQYSGRVLFELLQNALDRADSKVTVEIREVNWGVFNRALVVGNDGTPIRVDPKYDYDDPPEVRDQRRPDFNALCSLHTSNKLPEESVGNKGIGFRSVFWLGDFVRVWSRFTDTDDWWGLEMHSPLDRETWMTRLNIDEVRAGHQTYLDSTDIRIGEQDRRPSFHFPLPLEAEIPPTPGDVGELSTVVVVPIRADREEKLQESLATIAESHLNFVGLFEDRRDLTVEFSTPDQSFRKHTWPQTERDERQAEVSISHWKSELLAPFAEGAEHELSEPGAAVAWPTSEAISAGSNKLEWQPRVYGYLPTLIDSPFGVDLQGDFQLRTDRTGLRLDDDLIGPYNEALLEVAGEIHLQKVLTEIGVPSDTIEWDWIDPVEIRTVEDSDSSGTPRQDLWSFLNPKTSESDAAEVVIAHIESLLFPTGESQDAERYTLWAELASAFFNDRDEWPVATYREFWLASKGWIDRACQYSSGTKTWRNTAAAMGDALRRSQGEVAPVTASKELSPGKEIPAVPLPERAEAGETIGQDARHTRRLFLRRSEGTDLALPEALRTANRAVTSFEFPTGFSSEPPQPLGADQFNRWDVLRELRQLPHDTDNWKYNPLAEDSDRAVELQRELIRFAMDLYALDSQGGAVPPSQSDDYGPGWRALRNHGFSDNARTAGRSIATLFLPTTNGNWEPARQLTLDRVAIEALPEPPKEVEIADFLVFLGVTPAPPVGGVPLTLVEGGDDGIAVDAPPALIAAGTQWSPLKLGRPPRITDGDDPEAWLQSLSDAWDWLEDLIAAEHAEIDDSDGGGRRPLELIPQLRDRAWFPVDDGETTVTPPVVVDEPPTSITPADVTLVSRQQRQFPAVLWSLPKEASNTTELLLALDAVPGTDMESLGQNNAAPAFRLLHQLHELTRDNLTPIEENPRAREALTRLFDRILNTIAREHDPTDDQPSLPLLVYRGVQDSRALSNRALEWTTMDADVWIPTDTAERDQMRRFFPTVPLVAATIGRNTLSSYDPLAPLELEITRHVHPSHPGSEETEVVENLEETLRPIIPHLLALAGTTNQVDVDPATAAERWRSRVIRYVDDAWIDFEVTLGENTRRSDPRFKGSYNHALFLQDNPPTIIFDSEGVGYPPLDEFGEPLAKLLLEERGGGVGPSFARALGAYESEGLDRVERILDKRDALPLVDAFERHLRQLTDEEHAALQNTVQAALNDLRIQLRASWTRLSHIGPNDIDTSSTPTELTSFDVNAKLRSINLSDDQEPFRPQFSCEQQHQSQWESWVSDWNDRLHPYLTHLLEMHSDIEFTDEEVAEHLDEYIRETASKRVKFEPPAAVIRWIQTNSLGVSVPDTEIPTPDELEAQLIEFSPRFEPVEHIVTSKDLGLQRPMVEQSDPNQIETGVVELADLETEWQQTKTIGDEAERAARHWIAEQTAGCLNDAVNEGNFDAICNLLVSAIPGSGKTVEDLQNALLEWRETHDLDVLARGLHVSQTWDGVGFDLIGLEQTGNTFEPVRYEVKSLPDEGDGFKVHLTRNQLNVYRKVCVEAADDSDPVYVGDWKLLGVKPDRTAVDITAELDGLPSLVQTLQSEGYDHDGLLIYIEATGNPNADA